MKCPNCQTSNSETANFCLYCGHELSRACPRCNKWLPGWANFCDNCGYQLGERPQIQITSALQPAEPEAEQKEISAYQLSASRSLRGERGSPEQSAETSISHTQVGSHLGQYIPSELMEKLNAARKSEQMVGERRVVTMLFCDVVGSTASAEQLDPEEWTDIINGAFEFMIKPVYKYEGTVARLMGDSILAFFGAPIAHEDDPQRAVLAGLDIVNGIQSYRESVRERWGVDFDVRVGINTGRVVVGAVGSDLRMEYTAMGDAINLAARMEQTAQPGTVQVAQDTHKLIAPLFEFEELGSIEVKGKSEPVEAYRVLGHKKAPGRLRGIEGLSTEVIGRDQELADLKEAVDNLKQGVGTIVCLIGEAGLGKSRLIRELTASYLKAQDLEKAPDVNAPSAPINWYESASLSYESIQPYSLFQRLIRNVSGIAASDSAPVVRDKLTALLGQLPSERLPRMIQTFATLLGLEDESGLPSLEGEAFKRELFQATRTLWRELVKPKPVMLIFDDIHWSDTASVELLLHLFPLTEEIPLTLLCSFRPDRQSPSWQLKTTADSEYHHRYTEVKLDPLSEMESDQLVQQLLTTAELPKELRMRIMERASGNPFYVEEVVRTLIESGAVVPEERRENGRVQIHWRATNKSNEFNIPDNLQSLLAARIDRLAEETRQTLQLASVIGRSFYRRVLEQVSAGTALPTNELEQQLGRLVRMEMIQEAARLPEVEYKFRNPLTQEVAYRTILLKRRRAFHRAVGEAMEKLFPERLSELAPRLGYHFAEAGEHERALEYHRLAGNTAFRLYANTEAIEHYTRCLELISHFKPDRLTSETIAHLYTRRGRALELNSDFAQALTNYEELEALAEARKDPSLKLTALVLKGSIRSTLNEYYDLELGEALAQEALQLANELGDEIAEAKIRWNMLNLYRVADKTEEALAAGERSLELARKLDLREQLAFTANDLPYIYWNTLQIDKAKEVLEEARKLWRELDNLPMLADSLGTSSSFHTFSGELDKAIAFSDQSFQISESINNLWGKSYSRFAVGTVYWYRGEVSRAIEMMETCIQFGEQAGFLVAKAWAGPQLALVYSQMGQLERGKALLEEAFEHIENHIPPYRPVALIGRAEIYLLEGQLEKATASIRELENKSFISIRDFITGFLMALRVRLALEERDPKLAYRTAGDLLKTIRQRGFKMLLPEALYLQGKTLLGTGQPEAARESLVEAQDAAEEMKMCWWQWQILAALAEVESLLGNPTTATDLLEEASAIITTIADHSPADLRASFLKKPEVRAVLEPEGTG